MKKRMFGAFEDKQTLGCALVAVFAVFQAAGAELFVDATGANGAYTTIQAAVDAAAEGDVVTVAPGTYSTGGHTYSWRQTDGTDYSSTDRVWIPRRIHLRSSGGTAKTPYRIKCTDPVADMRFSYAGTGNASIYKLSAEFPEMVTIVR